MQPGIGPDMHHPAGEYFGLESHLVTKISQTDVPSCPKAGCLAVWGVWYRVSNKRSNNTFLDQILPYVNATGAVGALCFTLLLFPACAGGMRSPCVTPTSAASEQGCTALPTNKTLKLADAFPRNTTYVTYSCAPCPHSCARLIVSCCAWSVVASLGLQCCKD